MSVRNAWGLTLIEVVVATAVFGLVVFALTGFYLTASSRGTLGRTETTGALLAQQRLEFLKSKAYASLPGFGSTETVDELGNPSAGAPYTRVTAITTPYLGSSRLTRIDVTVNWLDVEIARTITLSSVVADF